MEADPRVYVMGLGVPDPKGIFGTTLGLCEKFGENRVMDMPCSENAMTGVAIGSALTGMRPVMTHQRIDFALLAMEQLVNQAANWHYMFGGKMKVPLVVRLLVGRGWGQGPQHSQNLHAWFAHIPGLKVVIPTTPHDAKGLLVSSIKDDNPVIFIEHRWLYNVSDVVPEDMFSVPIGEARIARVGADVTVATVSYMTIEALRAAEVLARRGIGTEVVDIRTLRPFDVDTVVRSVRKTGRLVVVDTGTQAFGTASEIVACVVEKAFASMKAAPVRVALPDCPTPTSPALSEHYYPRAVDIGRVVGRLMDEGIGEADFPELAAPLDVPDTRFKGPF